MLQKGRDTWPPPCTSPSLMAAAQLGWRCSNLLLLATPATSLEQHNTEPHLCQPGPQRWPPMLHEGDGATLPWWRVALARSVPTSSITVRLPMWPPSSSSQPKSRDNSASQGSSPRPPVSGMERGLVGHAGEVRGQWGHGG